MTTWRKLAKTWGSSSQKVQAGLARLRSVTNSKSEPGSARAWKQVGYLSWARLGLGNKLDSQATLGSGSDINQVLSWAQARARKINSWLDTPCTPPPPPPPPPYSPLRRQTVSSCKGFWPLLCFFCFFCTLSVVPKGHQSNKSYTHKNFTNKKFREEKRRKKSFSKLREAFL